MSYKLDTLFFNPTNQLHIDAFIENPSQSTIFEARRGFGVNQLIIDSVKSITRNYIEITNLAKTGAIGVEEVSEIRKYVRSKYNNKFFVIIPDAHNMTIEAQNTLLKNLEEPNYNIHYVMMSENNNLLLPTIKSRSQNIKLDKITYEQSSELLIKNNIHDTTKQTQIMIMASGLPQEIISLATDIKYFESRAIQMADAKKFIQGTLYESMTVINKYKNSRDDALNLLDDSLRLIEFTAKNNPTESIINKIEPILRAYDKISHNGNPRINLLFVVL